MNEMLRLYMEDSRRGSISDLFNSNHASRRVSSAAGGRRPTATYRRLSAFSAKPQANRKTPTTGSSPLVFGGGTAQQQQTSARAIHRWRIGIAAVRFMVRLRREARRNAQIASHDVQFLEQAYWHFSMENVLNCSEAVSRFLRTKCGVEVPQHEARKFLISIRHRKNEVVPFRHILLLVLELRRKQRQNRKTDVEEAFEMLQSQGGGVTGHDEGSGDFARSNSFVKSSLRTSTMASETSSVVPTHRASLLAPLNRSAGVPVEKFQSVLAQFELGLVVPQKQRNRSPNNSNTEFHQSGTSFVDGHETLSFAEFEQLLDNHGQGGAVGGEVATPLVTSLTVEAGIAESSGSFSHLTPGHHHHHPRQKQPAVTVTGGLQVPQQYAAGGSTSADLGGKSPGEMALGMSSMMMDPTSAFNPDDSDEDLPSYYLRQRVKTMLNSGTKLGRVSSKATGLKREHALEQQVKACASRHGTWDMSKSEGVIAYVPKKTAASSSPTMSPTRNSNLEREGRVLVFHQRSNPAAHNRLSEPSRAASPPPPPATFRVKDRPQSALARKLKKKMPSKTVDDWAGTPAYLRQQRATSGPVDHPTAEGDSDLATLRKYCSEHSAEPASRRIVRVPLADDIPTQSAAQDALNLLFGRHHSEVERINDRRAGLATMPGDPVPSYQNSAVIQSTSSSTVVAARQRPRSALLLARRGPSVAASMADMQAASLGQPFVH